LRLHTDNDEFLGALVRIGEQTGIRTDVLEKDYFITLLLKELSDLQSTLPAYFKGGTALYKALGSIRRFSEDIDLTVCIDGCSNSQAKRRLEKAANSYKSLPRTADKKRESNKKGSITSLYDYKSIMSNIIPDPLQRFESVKVEATSFTVSEPYTQLTIAPLVFDKAENGQKTILQEKHEVGPFPINTIRLERIFVDKVFASEFYYQRKEYFDVSKHIYDLSVMAEIDSIQTLLANPTELTDMMSYKRREEKARFGSDLSKKPISDFMVFEELEGNKALRDEFIIMQNIYVFDKADRLDFIAVLQALSRIRTHLLSETTGA